MKSVVFCFPKHWH